MMRGPLAAFLAFLALPGAGAAQAGSGSLPEVFVRRAEHVELFETLAYPARVVSKVNATILAETDGIVASVSVPLGKRVKRRERLMVVRHTDPVYHYAPVSITSPVAGAVSLIEVSEGSRVSRGQRLAVVTDTSKTALQIEVAASDLDSVRLGLPGELRLPHREQPVPVRVKGISPLVDPATGTASCELELVGSARAVSPGQVGQVRFRINPRKGFSVPEHSLVYRDQETFLRVVENGKVRSLKVALGKSQRGQVEVLRGLTAGLPVIERTSGFVTDGQAVFVQEDRPAQQQAGQAGGAAGSGGGASK